MIHCLSKHSLKPVIFLSFGLVLFLTQQLVAQTVDCSNPANCSTAECSFASTVEKGCRCFDNLDNDGDGKIDKADSNCAAYYGLTFVGEGSDCSITPPGSNTPFDLVNAPITSAQNTADTQSKVSVGDVDGDGIPDAVVTSKWNSEMRVVATTAPQPDGTDAGKVKSDFNLSGGTANAMFSNAPNSGPCKPSKLLFEHENLIADIDGDGKAELFGIVSNRGGSPSTPPTCFFLVAFKYAPADLVPLYKAVQIGTDRPGTFDSKDMMRVVGYDMSREAAQKVYAQAGIGPADLDVVELHDCFAHNELITYEALGLCPEGGAGKFITEGDNTYGGKVVTNPSGGLLSKGHPLGATGLAQCYELTHQLRGSAGARQVEGARVALQHNLGLGGACVVTMYRAA